MAYYGEGKHTFSKLIDQCELPASKSFLQSKLSDHFGDNKHGYIEQWLYNESLPEIKLELHGFVKGYLYASKKYCDVDSILCQREILPKLASIYIEMNKENKWDDTEELEEWMQIREFYENHLK
jgi:hypothetical protein